MVCGDPSRVDPITLSGMAFDAVAFDLVDACGRTFPLLLQSRPHGQRYKASGALVSRDSAHTVLATIICPEEWSRWSAALEMTEESARFFATYAPHGDVEANDVQFWDISPIHDGKAVIKRTRDGTERVVLRTIPLSDGKGMWVSLWATVNQPGGSCAHASSSDSEVLAMVPEISASTPERGHVVFEELHTLCCAACNLLSLRPEEYSMFSAYHPPAVVRSFAVAALSPVLLSVPSDVLGLIADYARLELPYVPMSLPDDDTKWSPSELRQTINLEDVEGDGAASDVGDY